MGRERTEMAKTSSSTMAAAVASTSSTTILPKDLPPQYADAVKHFFESVGIHEISSPKYQSKDYYSDIIRDLLQVLDLRRGRVSCVFSVLPIIANYYGGLHGGAVAAIAERLSIACTRTVVAEDKEIFLGELSISYLSAASKDEELSVDAHVVRTGRNLTVIGTEFRIKSNGKLVYTARATFYHMPLAKL